MLEKVSMLAHLSISVWPNNNRSSLDKYQTLSKYILPPEALTPINRAAKKIRDYHYKATLPWLDSSIRILASKNFFEYNSIMSDLKDEFYAEVSKFLDDYERWVNVARVEKDDPDFQAPDKLYVQDLFGVNIAYLPFPTTDDFRMEVLQDYEEEIKSNCKAELDKTMAYIPIHLFTQINNTLNKMMRTLTTGRKLRITSHRRLSEIVKDAKALNITNNLELQDVTQSLENIINSYMNNSKDLNNKAFRKEAYFMLETVNDTVERILENLKAESDLC